MSRLSVVVGAIVLGAAFGQGARDLAWGVSHWSRMGPLAPGESMPTFAVHRLDGEVFDQRALQGKVSVVTFWATWCSVCSGELVTLGELSHEYKARPEVQFLAVNHEGGGASIRDAQRLATAYAERRGLELPVAIDDGSMSRTFRVGPIPHTVIFDRKGTIRHVHQGRVLGSTIRDEIDDLLAD